MKAEAFVLFCNLLVMQIVSTFYIEMSAVKTMASWGIPGSQNTLEESLMNLCGTQKTTLYFNAKVYPVRRDISFLSPSCRPRPHPSPSPFKCLSLSLAVAVCFWIRSASEANFSPAFSGSRGYTQSWLMCHSASQQLFLFTLAMAKICADALLDALYWNRLGELSRVWTAF